MGRGTARAKNQYTRDSNNVAYIAACRYPARGEKDRAIEYYRFCAGFYIHTHRTVSRAFVRLKELGVDTSDIEVRWHVLETFAVPEYD